MRIRTALLLLPVLVAPALADLEHDVRCREVGFSKSVESQDHELESVLDRSLIEQAAPAL